MWYFVVAVMIIVSPFLIRAAIKDAKKRKKKIKELGAEKQYSFGKYLYGMKGTNLMGSVECVEIKNEFVFLVGSDEIGRIPVESISNIWVEDKSQVSSRFTATRIATLGIFALAAKKKQTTPSFYLTIEWRTGDLTNNAIFEFSSLAEANIVNNNLREKIDKVLKERPTEQPPSVSSKEDILNQIEKLAEMKNKGILTEEEFNQKKKELLDKM